MVPGRVRASFAFSAGVAAWPPQTRATPTRSAFFFSSRAGVASLQPLVMIILRSRSGSAGTRLPDIYFLDQGFRTVTPTEHCNPHCASMADEACGRAVRVGLQHPPHAASTSLTLFSLLLCPGISSSSRCDFGYRPRLSTWDPSAGSVNARVPTGLRERVRSSRSHLSGRGPCFCSGHL